MKAVDNVEITGISKHTTERAIERGGTIQTLTDALINPLEVTNTKYDKDGLPSKQYRGAVSTVVVNPDTGNVVSTIQHEETSENDMEFIKMKLNSIYSSDEFKKISSHLPNWEYDKDYSKNKIDIFDEQLEDVNDFIGYENEAGIFISEMIYKLRSNPQY
ncbi:hypothetical protein SalAn1F4_11010 [Streptococcus alactolyticus]|nr:hypothetical protein SalAn1F4_11010 [Streptococcus alactolyticus]